MRKEDFGRTNGRKRGVGGDTAAHFCIIGLIHQTAPTSPTCALCLISHNSTPVPLYTITVPHLHFYSWTYKILFSWLCCSAEHCYGIVGCLEAGAEWYLITVHFLPDWIWSQATMSHHSQCHLHTARHNLVKRQVRLSGKQFGKICPFEDLIVESVTVCSKIEGSMSASLELARDSAQ